MPLNLSRNAAPTLEPFTTPKFMPDESCERDQIICPNAPVQTNKEVHEPLEQALPKSRHLTKDDLPGNATCAVPGETQRVYSCATSIRLEAPTSYITVNRA